MLHHCLDAEDVFSLLMTLADKLVSSVVLSHPFRPNLSHGRRVYIWTKDSPYRKGI